VSAKPGTLHLIPVPIAQARPDPVDVGAADGNALRVLPAATLQVARRADYFLAENAKSARAFLKSIGHPKALALLRIEQIGHAPGADRIDAWLAPLEGSKDVAPLDAALLSEAGCPGIADPGADLVARAHERAIPVVSWVGPCSIVLALMASGMNGQQFRFLGYLPQERQALRERLLAVQSDARRGETQIFIETPYRNARLFEAILAVCDPGLRLCLAIDLTGAQSLVQTRTVGQWRALPLSQRPDVDKRATVFLLHGASAPALRH